MQSDTATYHTPVLPLAPASEPYAAALLAMSAREAGHDPRAVFGDLITQLGGNIVDTRHAAWATSYRECVTDEQFKILQGPALDADEGMAAMAATAWAFAVLQGMRATVHAQRAINKASRLH